MEAAEAAGSTKHADTAADNNNIICPTNGGVMGLFLGFRAV